MTYALAAIVALAAAVVFDELPALALVLALIAVSLSMASMGL